MNKVERIKAEKDGLDVLDDIHRYSKLGWDAITEDDAERMKWYGIFLRKRTPGYFMMRVRIPNGIGNVRQLDTIIDISDRFGQGILDLTTREQVQLRWFRIEHAPEIMGMLAQVGLTSLQTGMDNLRNVVGCALSGISSSEIFDASPVVREFTEIFVGNKAYSNLPRKLNVTITGCPENCTHTETQDIALVPANADQDGKSQLGFNVLIGGKQGSGGYRIATPLDVFVEPEQAARTCAAIVLIYRDHGPREARSRARLAFLVEERGEAWLRSELEERLGRRLPRAGKDLRRSGYNDHLGIQAQKQDSLHSTGFLVPAGRISTSQLQQIARLAQDFGNGEIRLTTSQNIIVPNVPASRLTALQNEPIFKELAPSSSSVLRGLVSCPGTEFCNLALIETKSRALGLARQLEERLGENLKGLHIHWSGCPAACGNHHVADIGLEGTRVRVDGQIIDAVHIYAGGSGGKDARLSKKVMENVPCDSLPQVLEKIISGETPAPI